ncbi:MAG: SRPBCC family protein, partial [Acidimicrobiales bacterium]
MSVIENSVTLQVTPDEVFALITEPDRLRRWMAVSARIDLHAGGAYRFMMTPGHSAVGEIVEVVPGKLLSFTWNWDLANEQALQPAGTVSIEIEPVADGTRVTLRHEGLPEDQIAGHSEGWDHFMGRLETVASLGDAGWDEWTSGPEDGMDLYLAAEASLA